VNVVIDRKAFYLKFWTKQAIPWLLFCVVTSWISYGQRKSVKKTSFSIWLSDLCCSLYG
jgi:hypothetical protein